MAMNNAVLEAAMKAAIQRLVAALSNKDAANALKLNGKTLEEITTEILALAATDTADAITAAIAGLTKADVGLGNVENFGVASEAEALAGAADKYVTAFLADKIAQAKVDALVGAAPETLDTIKEIADALQNDPEIINTLMTQIGTKETPEGAQAKADAAQAAAAADATSKADAALAAAKAYTDQEIAEINLDGKLDSDGTAANSLKLEGKSLQEVLDMVPPPTAFLDFGVAPYNVFVGADYAAMAAVGVGHYKGTVNVADVLPAITVTGDEPDAVMEVFVTEGDVVGTFSVRRKLSVGGPDTLGEFVHNAFVVTGETPSATPDLTWSIPVSGTMLDAATLAITGGSELTLQEISDALAAFIAKKATGAEAIAGTDDEKYITALALKAKVDDAIAALVDGAPLALDTLKELATALQDSESELAALVLVVDGKLGKTETAADSAKLGGKDLATVEAERDAAIAVVGDDVEALAQALTDAFNEAADGLETPPA